LGPEEEALFHYVTGRGKLEKPFESRKRCEKIKK
jgi:hypothetical protein